jgi:hypothetical protein
MELQKFTRRLTLLLIAYSLINLFLIAVVLIMRYDMNRKINLLERKIEVLEIHIFPEEYLNPPDETPL